jgi:hypothetical protein
MCYNKKITSRKAARTIKTSLNSIIQQQQQIVIFTNLYQNQIEKTSTKV